MRWLSRLDVAAECGEDHCLLLGSSVNAIVNLAPTKELH